MAGASAVALLAGGSTQALAGEITYGSATTISTDSGNDINFSAGAGFLLTIADGTSLTATLGTNSIGETLMSVSFLGNATTAGVFGISGSALGTVSVGVTGKTVVFGGDVSVDTKATPGDGGGIVFSSDGVVSLADGKSVSGHVISDSSGNGDFVLAGNGTVSGVVGAASSLLGSIQAGATSTVAQFDDDIYATNLNFTSDGTISMADTRSIVASVITDNNGTGDLILAGSTVVGTIGASGSLLNSIAVGTTGKVAQLDGNVFATTIDLGAGGAIATSVSFNVGTAISATVVNSSSSGDNVGEVTFAGNNTMSGTLGAAGSGFSSIFAGLTNTTVSTELNGNIYTQFLDVMSDGTLTLADGVTFTTSYADGTTGGIETEVNATGELTFAGNSSIHGVVGISASALNSVNVGVTGTTVLFNGDIYASAMNFSSDGSITLADGRSLAGAVTAADVTGMGDVVLAGNNTITGDVGAASSTIGTVNSGATSSTGELQGDLYIDYVNFTSDGTISLVDTKSLSGAVITDNNGAGDLILSGNTVTGTIGAAGSLLNSIAVGTTGKVAQLDGNIFATSIDLGAGGALATSVSFGPGTAVSASVVNSSTSGDNVGEITFAGNNTMSGTLGAAGSGFSSIFAGVTSTTVSTELNGNIYSQYLDIMSDGTLTLADGVTFTTSYATGATGGIETEVDATGELTFAGNSSVHGVVGISGSTLNSINVGVTGTTVLFNGDVYASAMNFSSDGSITIADTFSMAGTVTSTLDGVGDVVLGGNSTITGAIGASGSTLGTISVGTTAKSAQLDGGLFATYLDFSSDGTVALADTASLVGAVTSTVNGTGDLTFNGSGTVTGAIGASGSLVGTVNLGGTNGAVQLDSNVFASNIDVGLTTNANTLSLLDGVAVSSTVINSGTDGANEIYFLGNNTMSGTIGDSGSTLSSVFAGATNTATLLNNNIFATAVEFSSDGTISLASGVNIVGTVTTGANDMGELTFAGSGSVSGTVGSAGALVSCVNVGVTGTSVAYGGDVTVTTTNFSSDGSLSLADTKSIAGTIKTDVDGTGDVILVGNGTLASQVGVSGSALGTISVGATSTTSQFDADIYASYVNMASDGTLSVADAKTITGAVSVENNATGDVIFAGDNTVTGAMGSAGSLLNTISIGGSASTVQLDGDVYATGIDFATSSTGTLSVADGKNITSAITAVGGAGGTVSYTGTSSQTGSIGTSSAAVSLVSAGASGKTVTFSGDIYATNVSIGAGRVTFASNGSITGTTTVAALGTLDVGTSTVDQVGAFAASSTSTLRTSITNSTTYGKLSVTGTTDLANSNIYLDLTGATSYVPGSTVFTIVDSSATLSNGAVTVSDSSAVLSFTASSTATGLTVTATRASGGYAEAAGGTSGSGVSSGGQSVSTVLGNLGANATGAMAQLLAALDTMSAANLTKALNQLAPEVNGSSTQGSTAAASAVGSVISMRMASLNSPQMAAAHGDLTGLSSGDETGLSSGDPALRRAIWVQAFGSQASQGFRGGQDGYNSDTWGFAAGGDVAVGGGNTRIGMALSYAVSGVNGKGNSSFNGTDIDSYQVTLYGTHRMGAAFIDALASAGIHTYDGKRTNSVLGTRALSNHDGMQYTGKVAGGYDLGAGGITATPIASLEYSLLDEDGYTETGGGATNLVVSGKDTDSLKGGVGGRVTYGVKLANGMQVYPEAHAMAFYDFLASTLETTARFAGGGASFTTKGARPAATSLNFGTSVTLVTTNNFSVSAAYDAERKDKYISHTGSVKGRLSF
ncbi:MAG: autotransporter domain-containing protein [Alphaproteobacteria bacterium]